MGIRLPITFLFEFPKPDEKDGATRECYVPLLGVAAARRCCAGGGPAIGARSDLYPGHQFQRRHDLPYQAEYLPGLRGLSGSRMDAATRTQLTALGRLASLLEVLCAVMV